MKTPNTCLMSKSQSDNLSLRRLYGKSGFFVKTILILSTWFGCGLLRVARGTLGTIAAIPLVLVLNGLHVALRVPVLLVFTALAIWVSGRTEDLLEQDDPSSVVIDEVAGFLLTMSFLPLSWLTLGSGFILFRFFDILKPYPIKRLEGLKGGLGIVMDDLIAGLYACACVRIILFFAL